MGRMSVLFIKDGSENWAAQALEYDIAAQGRTIKAAMKAFEAILASEIAYAKVRGIEIFDGIEAAPKRYWNIFESMASPVEVERSPLRMPVATHYPHLLTKVA